MADRSEDEARADATDSQNRTGIAGFRARSADMLRGAVEFAPPPVAGVPGLARARVSSTKGSGPLGSTPPSRPPEPIDGLRTLAAHRGEGRSQPESCRLFDRLGERLSFERTSVRMYEALLAKYDALGATPGAPARAALEQMLRDEFDHYRMLEEAVAELGGDPTALTPSADLAATQCRGMLEVLLDPRTRLAQCLEAVLYAELVDNEAWRMLASLTERLGEREMAARFRSAMATESAHLASLRAWLEAL